jgi:hypothetical protein
VQMRRGTFARWYFSRLWQCIRASIAHVLFYSSGSTTHVWKREIRCCAYCNYGSCLFPIWEGESGASFLKHFSWVRQTPPPHPLAGLPVWCGLGWLSTRPQARPSGDEKSHSLPLTLPGFFHRRLKRAAAQDIPHQIIRVGTASTSCRRAGHHLGIGHMRLCWLIQKRFKIRL